MFRRESAREVVALAGREREDCAYSSGALILTALIFRSFSR